MRANYLSINLQETYLVSERVENPLGGPAPSAVRVSFAREGWNPHKRKAPQLGRFLLNGRYYLKTLACFGHS